MPDVYRDQTLGSPIILGGDKFALFAQPTFFQDYKLNVESLDHFDVAARAQGALVGGVKLFGRSVTVLDLDAHAFITQCGVDAAGKLDFLGQTLVGLPSVATQSTDCLLAFNTVKNVVGPVREGLVLARKLRKLLESTDEDAVCAFMEDLWSANNWTCDSLAELDPDPSHWKDILVSAAVNHYRDSLGSYLSTRATYVSKAVATEVGSGGAAESEFDLIPPTEFVGTSIQQAIPVGPLSVVIAASISGTYGLKGGLDYELDTGFEGGVVSGSPKLSAGAKVTPNLGVHAALYVGVGIGIGSIASASIGVEGQLTLIEVGVPIHTKVNLIGSSFTDLQLAGQGALRTIDGTGWEADPGEPATGVPSDRVYKWNLDWEFGGRLNLTTLSGQLAAAARVQFLWYSKTFRKKIAEFAGPTFQIPLAEASVALDGGFPIPQAPSLDPFSALPAPVGWAGEQIGFNAMKEHFLVVDPGGPNQMQYSYQFSPDGSADLCVPYNPGPR